MHTTSFGSGMPRLLAAIALLSMLQSWCAAHAQQHSELWGRAGENWSSQGRLPDWSLAGYERGEKPIPTPAIVLNVRDFGAVGNGEHDDTDAFKQAIKAAPAPGSSAPHGNAATATVIFIPAGRYLVTDVLEIRRPGIILRGESEALTTLYFPKTLTDIEPNWTTTTSGRPTSNYSWSGGFIRVQGGNAGSQLGSAGPALRGENTLAVDHPDRFEAGMEVLLTMRDDEQHTLTHHLYAGDPGPIDNIGRQIQPVQVFRVIEVDADARTVSLDRPLRFDVRSEWRPTLTAYEPGVTHIGVEHMTLEFPGTPYHGHFTELGHNGIAMSGVAHCWVRSVRFVNAESGIFFSGHFSTIEDVTFESQRRPDRFRNRGHHGITVSGGDNLTTRFDFQVRYIHDITVTRGSIGNVFSDGRGVDLNFDHHRRGPYENLFTDIDVGEGTRVWASGGGAALGRHCAARGTFWNIRSRRPIKPPGRNFAPPMINIVGIHTDEQSGTDTSGLWFEAIRPEDLQPQNLHEAQRERRSGRGE